MIHGTTCIVMSEQPLDVSMTIVIQSFVHGPLATINNKEISLQDFLKAIRKY